MMETDVPVCVLICLDVYVSFQDPKLVKNKQKITDFTPKSWKFNCVALILCWDISNDFLMSYMIETDVPVCVLICLDVFVGSEDQRLVKNKQKISDLVPSIKKNPTLVHWFCVEAFLMTL